MRGLGRERRKLVFETPVTTRHHLGGSSSFDAVEHARGWLTAIEATSGAIRRKYESTRPMRAAVTTTSSGLVFIGELTDHFLVLDARDGTVLFRHDVGVPLHSGVITHAVVGKQYVAMATGAATSFWRTTSASATVFVFSLNVARRK